MMSARVRPPDAGVAGRSARRRAAHGAGGRRAAGAGALVAVARRDRRATSAGSAGAAGAAGTTDGRRLVGDPDARPGTMTQGTSRSGTVTVSQTKNLVTRQIVDVSWTGFLPTVNATGAESVHSGPAGADASGYPVVLMECQGDDPTTMTPGTARSRTRTGSTTTRSTTRTRPTQVQQPRRGRLAAVHRHERQGRHRDRPASYVPCRATTTTPTCIGTNWYATWTDHNGTPRTRGSRCARPRRHRRASAAATRRTGSKGACSIVVVPIRPMPCINASTSLPAAQRLPGLQRRLQGVAERLELAQQVRVPGVVQAVPGRLQPRRADPVPTQGSELLNEAMLSWLPKFCRVKNLFKLGFTRLND